MSIFGSILEKLGLRHPQTAAASTPTPTATSPTGTTTARTDSEPIRAAAPVAPISDGDVMSKLVGLANKHPEKLNWKTSIVDLLKLLDLDSSYEARKELATELHCPPEKMADSAQMNIWLHKAVLRKLAENGGNIPAEMY